MKSRFSEIINSKLFAVIFAVVVFLFLPYLWRRYRDNDIKQNSKYTFAKIIKKSGSLKNGNKWHYQFYYQNHLYESSWSTHVDFDVKLGDYIIVNFSSKDPEHNKIQYRYKLKEQRLEFVTLVWDEIPDSLVVSTWKYD